MLSVTKEVSFAAAHSLPLYDGPCFNLHGHEWRVQVTVRGAVDKETGMIIDFVDLKKVMNEMIVEKYDHKYLNDIFENPTAENIVQAIREDLWHAFGLRLSRIRLYETPTSYCQWSIE